MQAIFQMVAFCDNGVLSRQITVNYRLGKDATRRSQAVAVWFGCLLRNGMPETGAPTVARCPRRAESYFRGRGLTPGTGRQLRLALHMHGATYRLAAASERMGFLFAAGQRRNGPCGTRRSSGGVLIGGTLLI